MRRRDRSSWCPATSDELRSARTAGCEPDGPQGFALQRVYTADRAVDETVAVHDRDVVLVPCGYHTVSAPPG